MEEEKRELYFQIKRFESGVFFVGLGTRRGFGSEALTSNVRFSAMVAKLVIHVCPVLC